MIFIVAAQAQTQNPPATPTPPESTAQQAGTPSPSPAAQSSGWSDIDGWVLFVVALALIAVLVVARGFARRRGGR